MSPGRGKSSRIILGSVITWAQWQVVLTLQTSLTRAGLKTRIQLRVCVWGGAHACTCVCAARESWEAQGCAQISGRLHPAASTLPGYTHPPLFPKKSLECCCLPKTSIGLHLFPAQGPSETLPLLEAPKVLSFHFQPLVLQPLPPFPALPRCPP